MDINPWKWRLSKNLKHITHGIPSSLRRKDDSGKLYASPGTDGCDYIHRETGKPIPFANFYAQDIHNIKNVALQGNEDAKNQYEIWFNRVTDMLPGVYHYSWYDLDRKIKTYKNYWSQHWQSLYNIEQEDTAENNMFFNKSWKDVSEDEIIDLSRKLSDEMGGWIFHQKIDFSKKTPYIVLSSDHPKEIKKWIKK